VVAGFHFLEHKSPAEVAALIADPSVRFDYYCWDLYARTSAHYKEQPESLAWRSETLHAIEAGEMPGCVVIIGNHRGLTFRRAFGLASVEPVRRAMHEDAVFDLASVTKAVATATSIAALVEDGKLAYDDSVARFVPVFATPDKRAITIRQLLTHTSGLPAVNASEAEAKGIEAALAAIASVRLVSEPGQKYLYSDLGFIVLGEVVHRASGVGLDRYAGRRLFQPLGLDSTSFVPIRPLAPITAIFMPTITSRGRGGNQCRRLVSAWRAFGDLLPVGRLRTDHG